MPKLTAKIVRKLETLFEGRITSLHDAQAEFRGLKSILIPESTADVERALKLVRAAGLNASVRSGHSVSVTDVGKKRVASPSAVISMEALRDVSLRGQQISIDPAVTTGDVAQTLAGKDLFLPLGDNSTQSIVSNVLSTNASPFLRSGNGRSMGDAVVEIEVVPTEGRGAGKAKWLQNKAMKEVLAGDRRAVITKLVFDATVTNTDKADRWSQIWLTSYASAGFATLCDSFFDGSAFPAGVDVSVRANSAAYAMNLVVIRSTGHGDADMTAVAAIVETALKDAKLPVLNVNQVKGSGSSVAAWVTAGAGNAPSDEVLSRFGSNSVPRLFVKFRKPFLEAVDFAIGVSARTGHERAPGVRAWAELQLTSKGQVLARAEILDAHVSPTVSENAHQRMAAAIPADKGPTAAVASRAVVRRAPTRAVLRNVAVLPTFAPLAGFNLVASNRVGRNIIPDFNGDLFNSSSGQQYQKAIRQYAVSSYAPAVVATRMTPKFVAQPLDADDVAAAVTYAALNNLKIVARSGGHQYCGLSSGGNDTLLLDMKLLSKVDFSATAIPSQVTVGPGIALRVLSKKLLAKKVVIPHGECPLVRIGGHVQTGGIGHQLRSLGATLDWVSSFKMVSRDPLSPGVNAYAEHQFKRPQAGVTDPRQDDVFRAVLGGGPGSWGVLTEITFDLLSDRKYPQSEGCTRTYLYEKNGFRAAMDQLQLWSQQEVNGTLPQGIDLFISVVSDDFPRPGVLLIETMARDSNGVATIRNSVNAIDNAVSIFSSGVSALASPLEGRVPLSFIADAGVREIGLFGLPASGREFDLPYKKSLHITNTPFSAAFCTQFVDLVHNAYNQFGLKVVVQAVVGGGEFKANRQKNCSHMQRRDALVQLVFDVFYEDGFEAVAEQYQAKMKSLLTNYSGGADLRMSWGTFEDAHSNGAQLDMSRQQVQASYYDTPAEYTQLKNIKQAIDPNDVFHTPFTVK